MARRAAMRAQVNSPTYTGGLWRKDRAALVDPARLVWGLKAAAMSLGVRIYEDTKATASRRTASACSSPPRSDGSAPARWRWPPTRSSRCCKRISHYIAPVYDYCMVTEPLSTRSWPTIGWTQPPGPVATSRNQFHYYRLTEDNRILWGGYDAIYYWRGKVHTELESRPETWAKLSKHFFDTFPQLEGVKFTHAWGGAIDTCSRFCVFWGQAWQGRVAYALGYTGLGVASTRFGAEVMLDLLDGKRSTRHPDRVRQGEAAAVPARAVPVHRHPGHAAGRSTARTSTGKRNLWLRTPRPARPRLRQLRSDSPQRAG